MTPARLFDEAAQALRRIGRHQEASNLERMGPGLLKDICEALAGEDPAGARLAWVGDLRGLSRHLEDGATEIQALALAVLVHQTSPADLKAIRQDFTDWQRRRP